MEAHMTKTKLNALLATTAVLALAACGGSSTSGSGSSFEQLSTRGLDLITQYGSANLTPVGSMPTGSATYNGVAAYSTQTSNPSQIIQMARTVSQVQITANFDNSTISGKAHNFQVSQAGLPVTGMSGELLITNGAINQNQLTANIAGTLTETGPGFAIPVSYNGTISGDFIGNNADAIVGSGTAVGTADLSPLGGSSNFTETVYAIWGAER